MLVTDFVVILHQLNDDPTLGAVVLHGDDPHDVSSVFRVGICTVLETGVRIDIKCVFDVLIIIQMALVVAESEKD